MSGPGRNAAIAMIPVRVDSKRLPGKALLAESGKPLFVHTCEAAARARSLAAVYVATDDDRVEAAAKEHGIEVLRTSPECATGSDRCAEAAQSLDVAVIIDVQGDWPEVAADDLDSMVSCLMSGRARCNTLASPLTDDALIADPNVVKVVRGHNDDAVYFSRSPVPFRRGDNEPLLRHIGVYGFTRDTLLSLPDLPSSGLAEREGLEQLRWVENRIPIQVLDAQGDPWGIEARPDYEAFVTRQTEVRR